MQITLIQSEIEQALKNYINDIMSVKDGMEIEIQLKATRGEEGTTAIIDIVPQKPKATRGSRTSGEIPAKPIVILLFNNLKNNRILGLPQIMNTKNKEHKCEML